MYNTNGTTLASTMYEALLLGTLQRYSVIPKIPFSGYFTNAKYRTHKAQENNTDVFTTMNK